MPGQFGNAPDQLRSAFLEVRTPRELARLLGYRYSFLVRVLYNTPDSEKYTSFGIPKRRGGTRTIEAPAPALKALQRRLSSILYAVHEPRHSAHGFLPDRGIVTNAGVHVGYRHVGNVDLENFFGSINFGRVRGLFLAVPYELPEPVATVLAQICCFNNALPQGAPTSPIVSNMIATMLDRAIEKLAKEHKCQYTRYADDLTFSTKEKVFPAEILESNVDGGVRVGEALAAVLKRHGFRPNPEKVRLANRYGRQEVTGLIVNQKVNIRREFIRQIRAMTHAIETFGDAAATAEHYAKYSASRTQLAPGAGRPSLPTIVEGKLEFVRSTLGSDAPVYLNLLRRYRVAVGLPVPAPAGAPAPAGVTTRDRGRTLLAPGRPRTRPRKQIDERTRAEALRLVLHSGVPISVAAGRFNIPVPLLRTWLVQRKAGRNRAAAPMIAGRAKSAPSLTEQWQTESKPGFLKRFSTFFGKPDS